MLAGNTAGGDAGALFAQAPTGLDISNVTFADNVAERGVGAAAVLRGAGAAVAAGAKDCSFTGNTAKLGNGGAVVIDSGLGALEVACEGCRFESNKAGAAPAKQLLQPMCLPSETQFCACCCWSDLHSTGAAIIFNMLLSLLLTLRCVLSVVLC
jgi:hypothetical protein